MMVRIEVFSIVAGPLGSFQPGVHEVAEKLAKQLVDGGAAVFVTVEETAVPEAAAVGAAETAVLPTAPPKTDKAGLVLTDVVGVGPTTAAKLEAIGIETPAQLAAADDETLAPLGGTAWQAWRQSARELLAQ